MELIGFYFTYACVRINTINTNTSNVNKNGPRITNITPIATRIATRIAATMKLIILFGNIFKGVLVTSPTKAVAIDIIIVRVNFEYEEKSTNNSGSKYGFELSRKMFSGQQIVMIFDLYNHCMM